MADKSNKVVKTIEHPLEDVFDIQKGSTEVEVYEREGELVTADGYDEKDKEIDEQYQEIYDAAMDGYDLLADELHKVEGKYKARVGEVSVQHLNAALNAASHKAKLKEHKDKLEAKGDQTPSSVTHNNTLIVDDRTALIRELSSKLSQESEHNDDEPS